MTEAARYRRGLGLSILIHAVIAALVYWYWIRTPQKAKPEPVVWEVSLFDQKPLTDPVATPPPMDREPEAPEVAAQPPEEGMSEALSPDIQAANAGPSSGPSRPYFDISNLQLPTHAGGAGFVGIPNPGPVQWDWKATAGGSGGPPGGGSGAGRPTGESMPNVPGASNSPPTAIVRIPPSYPMEARRQKLEGWVRIEFSVHTDGTVTDVKVRDAKPTGVFDQAAINAIQQWKFRPAMENGKPVRKRAAQTLKFELDKS
jgi:periplasmic protein TonB